jgi:hypothetical protein
VSSARKVWGSIVLASALVVVCAGALVWGWQVRGDDEQLATNRTQAQQQAGPLIAQIFSVGSDTYAQDRKRARALVTDEFAEQYAASLDQTSAPASSVTWTPVQTGISDVGSDHVDVVVSADVVETAPGSDPAAFTKVLDVRLEKVDGAWKLARADEVL